MKKIILWGLLLVFTMVGLGLAASAKASTIKWDLPVVWPAGNFHTVGCMEFAKLIDTRTKGQLKIIVHPGGALGYKGPEMLKVVRDGLAPIGEMLLTGLVGDEPFLGLTSMPFLMKSYDEASRLLSISRPYYDKIAARWNQKFLYTSPWSPSGIYTKKPVASMADFKGLKTRGYDKNSAEFAKLVGGVPIVLPWGEVYAALAAGVIDSVITSTISGVDGKLWEVTPHFQRLEFAFPLDAVTVNLDAWKKLPDDLKKIVLDTAREMESKQWVVSKETDKKCEERLLKEGVKIIHPTPEMVAKYGEIGKTIWADWVKVAGPDAEATLKEFLAAVRR